MKIPVNDEPFEVGTRYFSSIDALLSDVSHNHEVRQFVHDQLLRGARAVELLKQVAQHGVTQGMPRISWELSAEIDTFLEAQK